MKKRALATVLALVTVLSVLFCFTSCKEEKTLESIEFYDGEQFFGWQLDLNSDGATFVYGVNSPDLNGEFFGVYSDGSKVEIAKSDLKVKYEYLPVFSEDPSNFDVLSALPDTLFAGSYQITYTYGEGSDSRSFVIKFDVLQSTDGNFSVSFENSTIKKGNEYEEKIIIKNPDGKEFSVVQTIPTAKSDDTEGQALYIYMGAEEYEGLSEADKNNYEFLSTKVPFPASPIQPGEYVLIVLITTRNYKDIICTTQFTVTE